MDLIEFRWWRCTQGYSLVGDADEQAIVSRGVRYEQYRPSKIPALFVRFAVDTPNNAQGMLEFCNCFGTPGGTWSDMGSTREPPSAEHVLVRDLLASQWNLRRAFRFHQEGNIRELIRTWNQYGQTGLLRSELVMGKDGLQMLLTPMDLVQAMWLQLAQLSCSRAPVFRCERCSTPFTVGSGTGRRKTAKFCSNACKVAAFKERHASA
jgi:hypothetical protein